MDLGRSLVLVAAAAVFIASGAVAQSPTAGVSPSPGLSPPLGGAASTAPAPSATPFSWPTFPRERLTRGTFPDWPSGRPTATTTDRGIRLDLWLSSTQAAPGDWVQAIVRATNVGDDTAWAKTGSQCLEHTLTEVELDLTPTIPTGVDQTGLAADFKARVEVEATRDHFRSPRNAYGTAATGITTRAWAECTNVRPALLAEPIPPGRTRTERFYWRAARPVRYGPRGRYQPLHPGVVPVTVRWAFAGRGGQPSQERLAAGTRPIRATASISLTGDGPGVPSGPELIDAALADAAWRAWVEQDRTGEDVQIDADPLRGPIYPIEPIFIRRAVLDGKAPDGALEILLGTVQRFRDGQIRTWLSLAAIYLDPWTGEVIGTWFRDSLP